MSLEKIKEDKFFTFSVWSGIIKIASFLFGFLFTNSVIGFFQSLIDTPETVFHGPLLALISGLINLNTTVGVVMLIIMILGAIKFWNKIESFVVFCLFGVLAAVMLEFLGMDVPDMRVEIGNFLKGMWNVLPWT